jgi:hypothetical protein
MMLRRNVVEEGFISHQFEVYRVFVVFNRTLSYSFKFEETSMLMLYREGLVGYVSVACAPVTWILRSLQHECFS